MAITTSQMADALDANLKELFQDGVQPELNQYSKIFNIMSSNKQSEKTSYESGFSAMPEKAEGSPATFQAVLPGISETFTHKTYALGYEITEEAIEDNLQTASTFNKLPTALARSASETIEITAANVVNNGFSNTGYDGVSLFNESHPMLDGATQANRPTTDVDLSVTSLTAGLTTIQDYEDERGLKNPTIGSVLAVPTASWNVADELLRSEYKPFTANNEVNAIQEKNLQYMVWNYLTDADSWFLFSNKEGHRLLFFWRIRLGALKRGTDFDTTNLKHLARMRFSAGYDAWKGTYGTSGG